MAAADAAEEKGNPPPELEMAWDAKAYGVSPVSGGRSEQPAGLLRKMRVLSNVFDAMSAAKEYNRTQRIKDFHSHPLFNTYTEVMKLRAKHGEFKH